MQFAIQLVRIEQLLKFQATICITNKYTEILLLIEDMWLTLYGKYHIYIVRENRLYFMYGEH